MRENSPDTPPLFRTADISSTFEHIYRRPDELIGFADLLMRWPSLSFFKVPFFAVMRRVGEDIGCYLRLYEAMAVAFSDIQPDGVPDTTMEPEYEEDGSQKPLGKNAKPRRKTAAELEADRMLVHLRIRPPFFFRMHFEELHKNFDKLYFLRSEVEGVERAYPECRITSPLRADEDSRYFGLYKTTEKNIRNVAHQALFRMANCTSAPVQHPHSFRDGLLHPDSGGWWTSDGRMPDERDGADTQDELDAFIKQLSEQPLEQEDDSDAQWEKIKALSAARGSFRISPLPVLQKDRVWPDIHTLPPVKPRKRRDNKLKDIRPQVAVLNRLGIRDKEKMAKIIYSLHPFLLEREIPLLVSPRPGVKTSNETLRQQGRELLGKNKPEKHTYRVSSPYT